MDYASWNFDDSDIVDETKKVPPIIHKCRHCGKLYVDEDERDKHEELKHVRERIWDCSECEMSFIYKHHLLRHEFLHTKKCPYRCDDCKKSFARKDYLLVHRRGHEETRNFVCDHCSKSFKRKYHLVNHLRIHYGNRRKYICPICLRIFESRYMFKKHMTGHANDALYDCKLCRQTFDKRSDYVNHKNEAHRDYDKISSFISDNLKKIWQNTTSFKSLSSDFGNRQQRAWTRPTSPIISSSLNHPLKNSVPSSFRPLLSVSDNRTKYVWNSSSSDSCTLRNISLSSDSDKENAGFCSSSDNFKCIDSDDSDL